MPLSTAEPRRVDQMNAVELRERSYALEEEVKRMGPPSARTMDQHDRLYAITEEMGRISDRTVALKRPLQPGGGLSKSNDNDGGIGGAIVESAAFKSFQATGASQSMTLEAKTLITTTTASPSVIREPGIIETRTETPRIADLFSQGVTDQNAVKFLTESTFTSAAAETAEGGTKPESTLAFTETTEPVQKIATWIPATAEVLADVAGMAAYLSSRLPMMIRLREDSQLLNGNGTTPNLRGILNRAGLQTQAKGADPTPDAIFKAMTLIQMSQFLVPDALVIHPADWQDIRLLRTADGMYIWGSPADSGPLTLFGLRVIVTTAIPQNTALVGAFREGGRVVRREDLTVTFSSEHSTFFTENKVAILAEERLALQVIRPAAFCTVTGV